MAYWKGAFSAEAFKTWIFYYIDFSDFLLNLDG